MHKIRKILDKWYDFLCAHAPSSLSLEISFVEKAILDQKHYFHRVNNREIVICSKPII
jgi:hypothetical protein